MIQTIILVCAMIFIMPVLAFAIPTLNLGPATVTDSTVSFPVTLANSAGASISGITADVLFNSDTFAVITNSANLISATAGEAATASGKRLYQSNPSDGVLHIVIIDLAGKTVIADGVVAEISFSIIPSAPTGNYTFTNFPLATDSQGRNLAITGAILAATTSTTTHAKIYLSAADSFTVSNRGATLYGSGGKEVVTIANGMSGITLDQNIDQVNFLSPYSSYTFKQTGNLINVYDASGITLILTVPVQGDTDGTLFSFSNGMASAKLTGGVMNLGGATVKSSTPSALTPATATSTASTTNVSTAKVFLGADDSFTVSNSGTILYGNTGKGVVTIAPGISGVMLDQNIGQINFAGAVNSYAFKQTGNMVNVYNALGTLLLVKVPVQGDTDGTILSFSDGMASAKLTGGVMTLGGKTVSSSAPTTLSPALKQSL